MFVDVLSPELKTNYNTKTANRLLENVAEFKCLETKITTETFIHEEILNASKNH